MAREQASTLRAQWLGQQLREMRETAGLTLKDVGDYITRNASTVSRLESGVVAARVPEVLAYLDICGVDDPRRRTDLTTMAKDAWQKGWWDGFSADVVGSLIDWVWLESRATAIYSFQMGVIPGLLQTREYAHALISAADIEASTAQVARFVELRIERQRRLDVGAGLKFSAILDEGALHRAVGGPEVMRAQLSRLRELAGHQHVEIMVLPAAAGAHASPDGPFDVFRMAQPYPSAACVATAAGTLVVEGDKAERLVRAYDRLRNVALREQAALAFLSELERRLE
ncbi:helix-turn-helix domain-containing protein [Micromonospora sp. NPDC050397]|uniref:helix-turn-helix domain-containing protein n=1 Tax=Micromonospora sp. NPDC050397 TaxID=3364279 RepID=UPI00384B9590